MSQPPYPSHQPGNQGHIPPPFNVQQQPNNPQWQAPQPQGPGYFPYGTPPPKRNKGLIAALITICAIALIASGFVLWFITASDSDSSSDKAAKRTPEKTVTQFINALYQGDVEGMAKLTCKEQRNSMREGLENEDMQIMKDMDLTISIDFGEKTKVSDDEYRIIVDYGVMLKNSKEIIDSTKDETISVVQENKQWLVCDIDKGSSS